ncbi:MAG TPA: type VI secretion system protein IglI family protein, partial [Kofleriaceae bacterium]
MDSSTVRLNLDRLGAGLYRDGEPASPGLELGDPRLDAINDTAFKGNYAEAAALALSVWDEGIRDLRLIGYLLYGYYLERDVLALPFIFEQLTQTLSTRWDRIGPARKDKPADGALHWLFASLIRQLDGHEKARDERYQGWLSPEGTAAFAAAESASAALLVEAEKRFAQGKCFHKLRNLSGRLRDIAAALRIPTVEDKPAAAEDNPPSAAADKHAAETAAAAPAEDRRAGVVTVEGGAALGLLLRKLRLFERLVQHNQPRKAAVVARDVEQLLGAFDPIAF